MNSSTTDRKRIVFASIATGGSHINTATAMKEAIEREFPGRYTIEILDSIRNFGFEKIDAFTKAMWRRALANPWTIVVGQHFIDSVPRFTTSFLRFLLYGLSRAAAHSLKQSPPALVVANNGETVVAMTMAQRRFGLKVPVVGFECSTLNANALWSDPNVERFIVGSNISKRRLSRLGVPIERLDVVGYPVRQAFIESGTKQTARLTLGLPDRFTCLISLGAEGVGVSAEEITRALLSFGYRLQTVLIAGRNKALYRRARDIADQHNNLFVRGYVQNMADYLQASDVVIGKSGPSTTYEILAVGRPMLVPRKSGLAENKMLKVLESHGVGWYTPRLSEIQYRIQRFLEHPEDLVRAERVSQDFDFRGMSRRLAQYLDSYATSRVSNPAVCDKGLRFLYHANHDAKSVD